MSAKHTPGPWEFDEHESEIRPVRPGPKDRNRIGRFHAGREDAGQDARPRKVDGHLMAAAPELADALEEISAAGRQLAKSWRGEAAQERFARAEEMARAALKKAGRLP